jgi:hypothetical protein
MKGTCEYIEQAVVVDSQQWIALQLGVKKSIFPHKNIQKHTWNSPEGKTPKQMSANEQTAQIFDVERLNLKSLTMWK